MEGAGRSDLITDSGCVGDRDGAPFDRIRTPRRYSGDRMGERWVHGFAQPFSG